MGRRRRRKQGPDLHREATPPTRRGRRPCRARKQTRAGHRREALADREAPRALLLCSRVPSDRCAPPVQFRKPCKVDAAAQRDHRSSPRRSPHGNPYGWGWQSRSLRCSPSLALRSRNRVQERGPPKRALRSPSRPKQPLPGLLLHRDVDTPRLGGVARIHLLGLLQLDPRFGDAARLECRGDGECALLREFGVLLDIAGCVVEATDE